MLTTLQFTAASSLHQTILQEDDWHRCPCKSWRQVTFVEADPWSYNQNIQAADACLAGSAQCKSYFNSLHSVLTMAYQSPAVMGKWAWCAMRGKLWTQMVTLQSPAIGLKKALLGSGPRSTRCLGSLNWTLLTMGPDSGRRCTRFVIASILCQR